MNMKEIQKALGITADGIRGPVTTGAILHAADQGRVEILPKPVYTAPPGGVVSAAPVTGLKLLVWHWTVGTHTANDTDKEHYHFIVNGDGKVIAGDMKPEDNISIADDRYAAHTKGANTGAIGVAFAGMLGAQERPFDSGDYPLLDEQIEAGMRLSAQLCKLYGIPVGRRTTLTHAEVQPTLGVQQNGKWDITWLPGMQAPKPPIEVGDILRSKLFRYM